MSSASTTRIGIGSAAAPDAPDRERIPNDNRLRGLRWWSEVGWRHAVGLVMIVICVVPLLYVLSASLNPIGRLTGSNQLFSAISLQNYVDLWPEGFGLWMRNSMVVSSVTAIGTVILGASAAYAFSRFRFTGRRAGLTTLFLLQMFPQMLAFVAIFLLLLTIGEVYPALGLNTHLGIIAVYLGGALGVNLFLMYGFFNTIPRELDEAAKIDGASHAQIFWRIILRLVSPILTVVGLLSFIGTYSDFVIARVVLQRADQFTLAIGLYNWGSDERNAPWGLFAAGAAVAAAPVVLLFLFLQRYLVSGLTTGATKG
jgi:arabinogalactan oligomer/maltooligosaccharide transport system permease protein